MRFLFLYTFFKIFWNIILKVFIGVKFLGNQKLKQFDNFIIASNHNSHLDSIVLMTAIPPSKLTNTHPIAAADYFGRNKFTSKLTRLFINAVLISRIKSDDIESKNPVQVMIDLVQNGKSIILYPEGSRGEPGVMQKFKKGIGFVVESNRNVPVIPVFMDGIGRILPKGKKIILPNITKIYFGQALYFKNENAQEITDKIEHEIILLREKCIKNNNIK